MGSILGWEDPLEEGMAIHSSILAWRIPWTGEPGGTDIVDVMSDIMGMMSDIVVVLSYTSRLYVVTLLI